MTKCMFLGITTNIFWVGECYWIDWVKIQPKMRVQNSFYLNKFKVIIIPILSWTLFFRRQETSEYLPTNKANKLSFEEQIPYRKHLGVNSFIGSSDGYAKTTSHWALPDKKHPVCVKMSGKDFVGLVPGDGWVVPGLAPMYRSLGLRQLVRNWGSNPPPGKSSKLGYYCLYIST